MTAAAVLALPAVGTPHAGTPAAAPHTCSVQDLMLSWAGGTAKKGGTGNQDTAIVRVHNKGNTSCTLRGYPKVTLKAKAGHDTESLRETPRTKPETVTIAPGTHTTFTIVFLSAISKDELKYAIKPDKVDITLPGNRHSASLNWDWGPVTRQQSATHPGNYVGALGKSLKP
ncbi:DUF4232 domain-containing protein [Streptomyces sp. S186]|uniref:DUF4232 domain-containing protein n=1 Tax=Streptomyces sp. S186 TaxID=3434395 RepID=UPI003F66AAB6